MDHLVQLLGVYPSVNRRVRDRFRAQGIIALIKLSRYAGIDIGAVRIISRVALRMLRFRVAWAW